MLFYWSHRSIFSFNCHESHLFNVITHSHTHLPINAPHMCVYLPVLYILTQLKRCGEIINRASKKANELQALQWRVEETERRLAEKSNALERPMQETDEQLESMLANFEDEMRQRSKLLRDLQKAVDALNGEIGALRAESDQLNTQRGLAVSLTEQVDQCKKTVCDKIQQAARKHKVQLPEGMSSGNSGGGSRGRGPSGAAIVAPEMVTVQLVRDFIQSLNNKVTYRNVNSLS
jgi:chromosome segregation ATPase